MAVYKIFDVEEQNLINHATKGEALSAYKKEDLLEHLDFIIASSEDDDIVKLYADAREKISALDETEWEELLGDLPFKTPYSSDSGYFDEAE